MKFSGYIVESSISSTHANNLGRFMDSLRTVVLSKGTHNLINIGDEITFVPLLIPKKADNNKKHLLICSGFHGDENSGPWSIIKYLNDNNSLVANVSYLPLVNPVGFKQFKRHSMFGHDLNIPDNHRDDVITDNLGRLLALGIDGVLNLHEDPQLRGRVKDQTFTYLYHSGDIEEYVVNYTLSTLNDHFDVLTDLGGSEKIIKGLVRKETAGTWEDILDKEDIPNITTEYSSREDFGKRLECGYEVITGFVELMA